jgi:hypothetical protein
MASQLTQKNPDDDSHTHVKRQILQYPNIGVEATSQTANANTVRKPTYIHIKKGMCGIARTTESGRVYKENNNQFP